MSAGWPSLDVMIARLATEIQEYRPECSRPEAEAVARATISRMAGVPRTDLTRPACREWDRLKGRAGIVR